MGQHRKPRILIVYPSCYYYPDWMERVELKTSQLLLGSFLSRFFDVDYADFEITIGRPNSPIQIKRFERRVRAYLEKQDFDILALSCWTSLSYRATLTIARISRELYPDKLIVVGGYHATALPHEFKTADNRIDYVITGEGELSLKEIAESWPAVGRPVETTIVRGPALMSPDFADYDWSLVDDFIKEHFSGKLMNIYLYLSRGCPFGCSFCMEPLKDRHWRAFPPDKSIELMFTAAEKYSPMAIAICDACFGMRPKWRKDFLRRLAEAKPDYWIVFETRPEYLDEEDIKLLSNLKVEIQFGLESCSAEMLLLMHKTKVPDKFLARFREVSHMLSDNGVLHRANLIFNHPGETRKTLEETFAFIDKELERTNSSLMWACHGYMHFPGCELDINREYYEKRFGSRFLSTRWWHDADDQYASSMRFIPSDDLGEAETGRWEKMLEERRPRMKSALTLRAFKFAATKYFLDWRYDPRYKQS